MLARAAKFSVPKMTKNLGIAVQVFLIAQKPQRIIIVQVILRTAPHSNSSCAPSKLLTAVRHQF